MADDTFEIDDLFPEEEAPDAEDILDASTGEIEELEADDDIEIVEADPPPIGRAWLFDFQSGGFVMDGRSPATVRGDAALLAWVEKCLRTHQGSSVVQPSDFGLNQPLTDYLGGDPDEMTAIYSDIEEALTFHPDITTVENIEVEQGTTPDGDAALSISFVVVRGDGGEIPFTLELEPEAAA